MKYCKHCGNEVLDDAVICPKCGCSVDYKNAAPKQPPIFADSYSVLSVLGFVFSFFAQIVGLVVSIIAYSDAKNTGSLKSQSMAKAGIIISSVIMGLVAFIFVFWFIIVIVALNAVVV